MSNFLKISKSSTIDEHKKSSHEKHKKDKKDKKDKKHKNKERSSSYSDLSTMISKSACCPTEQQLDCCSPAYLRLDKVRQGWSDIATTGGESLPMELVATNYTYTNSTPPGPQSVITGGTWNGTNGTVNVTFNSKDRAGNYVQFPGTGVINFYYDTLIPSSDLSVIYNFSTNPVTPLNLATLDATLRLTGQYFDGTSWVGMSLTDFLSSPEYGGEYTPPSIIPTYSSKLTQSKSGSYTTTLDNALWSYLFVQTHRYNEVEKCNKSDQILGWYVNTRNGQLILYHSEFILNISDDRLTYITIPTDDLTNLDKQKLFFLNLLYNLTTKAIGILNNTFKTEGNILKLTDGCGQTWLLSINRATSGLSEADPNATEYTVVASIICKE